MKLDALTPQQEALLNLPVVFTPRAWHESVYIAQPLNIAEQGYRLTAVLQAVRNAIIQERWDDEPLFFDFSHECFPSSGERLAKTWLKLSLVVDRSDDEQNVLNLMLKQEAEALEKRIPGELFALGELVMTQGVEALIQQGLLDIAPYLDRHLCGDWGELSGSDRAKNERAVLTGASLFSEYEVDVGAVKKLWIVTSADRRFTSLLLPVEPTLPQLG
ncbi:hypothetical protein [Pseudomonas gingeri]|uniref:hypothetical protein n=1 Tax=Pseudomonas gingeri TaxID=117681 RepID=UPI0021088EA8|nr:hypothetical protein [Pseudomonas gingeri]